MKSCGEHGVCAQAALSSARIREVRAILTSCDGSVPIALICRRLSSFYRRIKRKCRDAKYIISNLESIICGTAFFFFFLFEFETVAENEKRYLPYPSPSFLFICFFFFSLVSFSSYILIVLISILIPIEDIRQEFDEKERHSAIYIVGKVLYF